MHGLMKTYQKEAENRTKLWNDKTIDFDLDLDIDEDFQEKDSYVTSRSGNPRIKGGDTLLLENSSQFLRKHDVSFDLEFAREEC